MRQQRKTKPVSLKTQSKENASQSGLDQSQPSSQGLSSSLLLPAPVEGKKRDTGNEVETIKRKKHANDTKAWQKACEQGMIVYLQNEF